MGAASETLLISDNHNKNMYLAQVVSKKHCGRDMVQKVVVLSSYEQGIS